MTNPGQEKHEDLQPENTGAAESNHSRPPSPADVLREIAERQSNARQRREISERMKQAAREMMQRMTPEEREQWAREWQKQNQNLGRNQDQEQNPDPNQDRDQERNRNFNPRLPADSSLSKGGGSEMGAQAAPNTDDPKSAPPSTPTWTEDVDIRGEEIADRPLTDFLDPIGPDPADGASRTERGAAATERIRQAQRVAERAVNDSAVPARYHQFIKRVFGNLYKTIPQPSPATQPGS